MRQALVSILDPIPDALIDATAPADRAHIASIWRARAGMEQHVAAGFSVILRELVEAGASDETLGLVAEAVPHEIEHARLCLSLASRYAGASMTMPAPEPLRVPELSTRDLCTLVTFHLAGMSCINETIASVRLAEEHKATTSPTIRRALELIARDETLHARAGYCHLASPAATPAAKSELSRLLPSMLRASFDGLSQENAFLERGFVEHGLPSREATLAIAAAALRDVVLPGFSYVGVDVRRAREWAETRFPAAFGVGAGTVGA